MVMAGLGSANWKERNHTMDDIENIIRTAARIQSSVGDLIQGLKVLPHPTPPYPTLPLFPHENTLIAPGLTSDLIQGCSRQHATSL